jgi:hypothetical protein
MGYIAEGRRPVWRGRRLIFARSERSDPNQPGIERLFSVLPDGDDLREIPLPAEVTILPDVFDETRAALPASDDGEFLLACAGPNSNCDDILVLRAGGLAAGPIRTPEDARPRDGLVWLDFVAGDTHLLWLNGDGELFLQSISSGESTQVAREVRIVAVIPYEGGGGAVLQLDDGRFFEHSLMEN